MLLDSFFDVPRPQEDALCDNCQNGADDDAKVKPSASILDDYTRLEIRLICCDDLPLSTMKSRYWKDPSSLFRIRCEAKEA